jgi:hypothetical protein
MSLAAAAEELQHDVGRSESLGAERRARLRTRVATMHGGALCLQWLIENLLSAGALSQGRLHRTLRPISVPNVVEEVATPSPRCCASEGNSCVYGDADHRCRRRRTRGAWASCS